MQKNKTPVMLKLTLAMALLSPAAAQAGWWDDLFGGKTEQVKQEINQQVESAKQKVEQTSETVKQLSNEDIAAGLKQALDKGVTYAVDTLGDTDGFLKNPAVTIPMPAKLSRMEKALRKIGQDKYADQFVTTMNRAAEAAVPLTADILKAGVQQLTFNDAKQILQGPDDAATQYLRKVGSDDIRSKIAPIIQTATSDAGVTRVYKKILDKLSFMGSYVKIDDYDIDRYVTDKTMDGLFTMIAEQEKLIREDPKARTTQILQDVFK